MARSRGFRVSLFGVHLAVACDSDAVASVLDRYVLPWLPRAALDSGRADRIVDVRQVSPGAGLEIAVDGAAAAVAPTPLAAVPHVQRALDEAIVRCQSEVAVVHAGVVVHEDRAIVLPAETRAGKSTLVAELVRQGATYGSDEYALIDAGGCVHPYPRAILLRDESGDDQSPRLAADLGGTVAQEAVRAGLIVGVRRVPGAAFDVTPTTQAEAVLLLLRNTPHALAEALWILERIVRAVEATACYVGVRGEAAEAARSILALASSVSREAPGDASHSSRSRPPGSCASP
jgi:hypothetical protein